MIALPVVYDGERHAELDIVSIPGLPTLHPQYKLKDHQKWLREVLRHQVPQARIMAFQYDFAKQLSDTSWRGLENEAARLLYSLVHRRELASDRPVIFVCYSFGAFILKKALLIAKETPEFRSIFDNTGGIIFLACLNDDGFPGLEDLCLKCAAVEFGTKKKHDAVECLRKSEDWNILRDVMESFRLLRCTFPVRVLYETKKTTVSSGLAMFGRKAECLCTERISSLGWENEKLVGIPKDHGELTMYPHRGDTDSQGFFESFMKTILELVHYTCPPTAESMLPSDELNDTSSSWTMIPELANATSALSLAGPGLGTADNLVVRRGVKVPCHVMGPYEISDNFVAREDIVTSIHQKLGPSSSDASSQRTYVVTGLGGMGKTQIALSYAFQHRNTFPVILWADADGQSKLSESFIVFAKALGLGDLNSLQAKQGVKDCLQHIETNYLLVFDNADGNDKHELLREFWPGTNARGSILITSRDQALMETYPGLELTELSEDDAMNLLLDLTSAKRTRMSDQAIEEERNAASKIVEKIGYLPLGISQAASIVMNESFVLTSFLEAYDARDIIEDCEDVRTSVGANTYKYSLRTVWNMNFDRLDDDQKQLMKTVAFLDPGRLQVSMLKDGAANTPDSGLSFMNTTRRFWKCYNGLCRSNLVSQSVDRKELGMHRLVQASCQLRMNALERRVSFTNGVSLIKAVWPVPERMAVHNPSLWEQQRALLPHVQKLCEFYVNSCGRDDPLVAEEDVNWDFASILYEAGWFCYESGLLESVAALLEPAEKFCQKRLERGGGYRILADIYGGLGSLDTESNQFQKAFDDFSKQWEYLNLAFEAQELQRPSIWEVFGLGRLANGLQGLHCYSEAEKYYRKCLETWKGLPGDQKIFTTHLATCLWLQGRLEEGEKVVRSVIKDENDTTNFRTAMAMYCLGNIQIAQSQVLTENGEREIAQAKLSQAMQTHAKVSRLWEITLGATHHKSADAKYKLAWHFHRLKEYEKAMEYLDVALSIYIAHPAIFKNEIARTKYKIGCVFQDIGEFEQGTRLINEAERLRQEIVPPENWEPAEGEGDYDEIVQFWTR